MTQPATLTYYDDHADDFIAQTVAVDMLPLHQRFLAYLAPGSHILDAGCGSGRDARAFLDRGYQVSAFDGSATLAERASVLLGQAVQCRTFADVTELAAYNGLWACASLLHVAQAELGETLTGLANSLRPHGVLYASFKEGVGERVDAGGRHFSDMNANSLQSLLEQVHNLTLIEMWTTADRRGDRPAQIWWNVLARHREASAT